MANEDVYNFDVELEDIGDTKGGRTRRKSSRTNPGADSVKEFGCELCDRSFNTLAGLKRHSKSCEKIKEEYVEQDVDESGNLDDSIAAIPADEYILPTNVSDSSQNDDIIEMTTLKLKNPSDIASFIQEGKCDCCGEDSETAHAIGEFQCADCTFFFTTPTALTRHRTLVHDEGETFNCSRCDVRCPDKKTLKYHLRVHNPNFKPVSCPVCHKQFSRKYHLARHNMQTGCDGSERPTFPCQVCLRVFTRKDNLREHLRAHAGQTKRKQKYTCEYCSQEFAGMFILNQHKKLHLGDKPHCCDMCDKKFSTSGALKKHRRKHTGERPYECKQCFAKFAAKETLNRHTRIHTGVKPHSCLFCGKSFIQATQLRAHIFHHTERGETKDFHYPE